MSSKTNEYLISYSQNREDVIISSFFSDVKKGFYVDVGANHPLYHSVTKLFYDKGWYGINLEPNPKIYKQLVEHRPKDINLMQAVGDSNKKMQMRVYHSRDGLEGVSTLSTKVIEELRQHENEDTKNFDDITVEVNTLKEIFSSNKVSHIHFMKIDVEGFEYKVLTGNDWTKFRPELLCIESTHIEDDWSGILKKADYKEVFFDGLNRYYLAEESHNRSKNFDYSLIFLTDRPVIGFEIYEKLKNSNTEIEYLKKLLTEKQKEIQVKENFINEITPLKRHIKRQILARIKHE